MAGYRRITCTPPVIDIDGSLWSVFVSDDPDAVVRIQVCDGMTVSQHSGATERLLGLLGDARPVPIIHHDFDGEYHDGDLHLLLDRDAAYRLLRQLEKAFEDTPAAESGDESRPVGRFCYADCADCESGD